MPNNPNAKDNLQPFKKGYDIRRNLKGVPKSAIEARKHFYKIAAEILESDKGDMTRYDAMIRLKFGSRAPKDFETIVKILHPGLLKDEMQITGGGDNGEFVIRVIEHKDE